jgi:hypothetical protein
MRLKRGRRSKLNLEEEEEEMRGGREGRRKSKTC